MIFYFLISIVFIAELIITFAIVLHLIKLDKIINKYNVIIEEAKPLIKEMLETTRQLSEEFLKITPKIADKIKLFAISFAKDQLKNLVGALVFWLVKTEVEKHV